MAEQTTAKASQQWSPLHQQTPPTTQEMIQETTSLLQQNPDQLKDTPGPTIAPHQWLIHLGKMMNENNNQPLPFLPVPEYHHTTLHNIHEPGDLTTTLLQYTSRARQFLTQQHNRSPRLQHKFPHFTQQLQDTHFSPQLIYQLLHAIHCEQQDYLQHCLLPTPVTMSFNRPQPPRTLDHVPIPNQHKHHYPHPEWDFGSDSEQSDDSQWSPDYQDPTAPDH